MEKEYKVGETYRFETLGIFQNSVGNNYIAISDGERDTYRVKPLPFQEEGSLPKYVYCKVQRIDSYTGFPILVQDMFKFYSEHYEDGGEYEFKVIAIETDFNTKAEYYQLRDEFGIDRHRLYFKGEPKYSLEETHLFKVEKINEKGFLELNDTSVKKIASKPVATVGPVADTSKISIAESEFGHEDQKTEFKSSLVFCPGAADKPIGEQIDSQVLTIVKTIAAFMNADGGKLYIGVNNNGVVCGINDDFQHLNEGSPENDNYLGDYKNDTDSYELKIRNAVRFYTNGNLAASLLAFSFNKTNDGIVYCCIDVKPSKRPIFIKDTLLYVRDGNQKVLRKGDEITYFISERMKLSIKDVFDVDLDDFDGVLSKQVFEDILKKVLREHKLIPESPKPANITVPVPQIKPPVATDEVWNHFTWYNDGSWSFQKDASTSPDVYKEVCVHKSEKDGRIVMCYDNGCVNEIIPSKARAKKTRGKIYSNGWNTKAKLLAVYVTLPIHYIAAFSIDIHTQQQFVKLHLVSDFNPVESLSAQGATFIHKNLGIVQDYKLISVDHRHAVPNLIFPKGQTSTSIGIPVNSVPLAGEIDYLKNL